MSSSDKLILVVAGDQLACDILKMGELANALTGQTARSVQIIRVGDDAEMAQKIQNYSYAKHRDTANEGGEQEVKWLGPKKTAEYYVGKLSAYAAKVASELPESDWEPAGVLWLFGLSDVRLIPPVSSEDRSDYLADLQDNIEALLLWNPFGVGMTSHSYIGLIPEYPAYSGVLSGFNVRYGTGSLRGSDRSTMNTTIGSAVTATTGAYSIAVPETVTGWDEKKTGGKDNGLRKIEAAKDYGLSEAGARAYASALAGKVCDALEITPGDGESSNDAPKKTIVYTPHTQNVSRNKLSGFEGQKVSVLIDGVPYHNQQVGADGSLTLPVAGKKVVIGFPYPSVLAPMPIETDSQSHGSTLGKRRAYGKCEVRVYRSKGGRYGASSTNDLYDVGSWLQNKQDPNRMFLYDIPYQLFRDDEWPYSGDVEFSLPSGQDPDTTIWIVQEEPWPLRIVSIMCDVDFGQM